MRNIYSIGETVYDIIFKNGKPLAAKAGGSMLNSTVSMGRMNLPAFFISEYAFDNIGDEINSFLNSCNVNTQYIYRYNEGKTSIAIAFLNENNDAQYNFYKQLPEKRLSINFPKPGAGDIVLFGSFYALNKEVRAQVKSFAGSAKEAGAIIIYDPNFRKAHLHELAELLPLIKENMQLATLVRGSNEDFNMIFGAGNVDEAYNIISGYCNLLVYTNNSDGVYLKTPLLKSFYPARKLKPVSTIGAGDNFNAGVIYGLIKENFLLPDLALLDEQKWQRLLQCGTDFASEVCMGFDNYISEEFAAKYSQQPTTNN